MLKKLALATITILSLQAVALAVPLTTWVYEASGGGYFEYTGNGNWTESTVTQRFYFKEVERTAEYVQLHDASRKISIRLHDQYLRMHYPGSGGWINGQSGY
jgi:hypothetical protein